MRTFHHAVVAAVTATALCFAMLSGAPGAVAEEAIDPAVAHVMTKYGLSQDAAVSRLERQEELVVLMEQIRPAYEDVLAGVWIDETPEGAITVAATGRLEELERDLGARFSAPALLAIRDVKHRLPDLIHTMERILVERRAEQGTRSRPHYGVALDVKSNKVLVFHPDATEARRQAFAVAHGDRVQVVNQPLAVPDQEECHTSTAVCEPPLRGGVQIRNRTSLSSCTLGFVAKNASGAWYALTAGHCGVSPDQFDQRIDDDTLTRSVIGGIPGTGAVDVGNVDGARVFVNDPTYWRPSRWVRHSSSAQAFAITSRNTNPGNAFQGIELCRGGGPSGTRCGAVQRTYVSPANSNNTNLLETGLCSHFGDSGSPYYTWTSNNGHPAGRAFAMHVTSSNDTGCVNGELSYSSHIWWIENELDVQVHTS